MKKGLLGLLVAALTIVGCQNYDDQFDDLNTKIATLQSSVSSLDGIQTSVGALSTKLDQLANSALTDSDLTEILAELTEVQTAVDALDTSAIETEVADLNSEIEDILAKLGDLLSANAFYDGNLTITNLGQLANVQDLINTGEDDPTVTVKGNVLVTVTSANGLKDSIASVNLILSKIRAVQGTVTVTSEVDASLPALTYATGDVDLNGTDGKAAITADKLLTVDGNMSITGLTGVVAFPALSSVGTVQVTEVSNKATITTLNLAALSTGTVQTASGALILPLATNVHLGGVLPAVVTLNKCVDFAHTTGGSQGNLDLTLGGTAASLSLGSTKFTGTTTITTKGNIFLTNVTEIATTTLVFNTAASEAHLPALTKIVGPVDISAKATTVDLSKLATLNSTLNLHGPTSVSLPELSKVNDKMSGVSTITAPLAISFTAPKLDTTSTVISLKPATDLTVSIKNLADVTTPTNDIVDWARVKTLTLSEQKGSLDVSGAAVLASLTYKGYKNTAGAGAQNNALTVTQANTKLTALTLSEGSYLGTLTVSGSVIVTLNTNGHIVNTVVNDNSKLTAFNFGHTHVQGDNESTVHVSSNAVLPSLDMSSLSKVGTVTVTSNAKLATLVAPSADVLATSLATITVKISGNKLAGTYTPATAPTGTVTYSAPAITGAALTSFKAWINANANVDLNAPTGADRTLADGSTAAGALAQATGSGVTNNSITYDINLDEVDNTSTTAAEKVTLSSLMNADTAGKNGANAATGDGDDDVNGNNGVTTYRELLLVN